MKWITLKNLTWERLPCVWLIKRFIDPNPELIFVDDADLDKVLTETKGIPFDIDGAELAANGQMNAFDKFLWAYRFTNPALDKLGALIHKMDLPSLEKSLVEAGRADLLTDLSRPVANDEEKVNYGVPVFDALYNWIKDDILSKKVVPQMDINKIL